MNIIVRVVTEVRLGLVATDQTIYVRYLGHRYCIISPSGQLQPCQEWVKGLVRPYGVEL
jgi:hypothetical protein